MLEPDHFYDDFDRQAVIDEARRHVAALETAILTVGEHFPDERIGMAAGLKDLRRRRRWLRDLEDRIDTR